MAIGSAPGDCLAACVIDPTTDTLFSRSFGVGTLTVNAAGKDYTLALTNQAQANEAFVFVSATLQGASGVPLVAPVVSSTGPGTWNVQLVDATGALAAGSAPLHLIWFRAAAGL